MQTFYIFFPADCSDQDIQYNVESEWREWALCLVLIVEEQLSIFHHCVCEYGFVTYGLDVVEYIPFIPNVLNVFNMK